MIGPPGSGKRTQIAQCVQNAGYTLHEMDLTDPQWKTVLQRVTRTRALRTATKRAILLQRVDAASCARNLSRVLGDVLPETRVPILLTAYAKPRAAFVRVCSVITVRAPTAPEIAQILRGQGVPHAVAQRIAAAAGGDIAFACARGAMMARLARAGHTTNMHACEEKDARARSAYAAMDALILRRGVPADAVRSLDAMIPLAREDLVPAYVADTYPTLPSVDAEQAAVIADSISLGDMAGEVMRQHPSDRALRGDVEALRVLVPAALARCDPQHPPPRASPRAFPAADVRRAHNWTRWGFPEALKKAGAIRLAAEVTRLAHRRPYGGRGKRVFDGGVAGLEFLLQRMLVNGVLSNGEEAARGVFGTVDTIDKAMRGLGLAERWKKIPRRTRTAMKKALGEGDQIRKSRRRRPRKRRKRAVKSEASQPTIRAFVGTKTRRSDTATVVVTRREG